MPPPETESHTLLCAKEVAAWLGVKKAKMIYELWDLGPVNGGMASVRIGRKARARRCSKTDVLDYLKRRREVEAALLREREALIG